MNIHQQKLKIRKLLLTGKRVTQSRKPLGDGQKPKKKPTYFPGVYIISRVMNGVMKLGEASGEGGLYDRMMNQYKICYPNREKEFYLRYLVICPKGVATGTKSYSQVMEAKMLKIIDSRVKDSYSKEYIFAPDIAELDKKMVALLKTNEQNFSTAIKFGTKHMYVFDGKGFNDTRDFDDLSNLNPVIQSLLDLKVYRSTTQPKTKIEKKPKPPAQVRSQRSNRVIRKPKRYR